MSPREIAIELRALCTGHFVLTSGKHSDTYFNKDALYPHPYALNQLINELCVQAFVAHGSYAEGYVGPEKGGIILSALCAAQVSRAITPAQTVSAYCEKQPDGTMAFRRGYDRVIRKRTVIVMEDVMTTGGSVKKCIAAARAAGAQVAGVMAIVNRGGVTAEQLDVPWAGSLIQLEDLKVWEPRACPLCQSRVPVSLEIGKGAEYVRDVELEGGKRALVASSFDFNSGEAQLTAELNLSREEFATEFAGRGTTDQLGMPPTREMILTQLERLDGPSSE